MTREPFPWQPGGRFLGAPPGCTSCTWRLAPRERKASVQDLPARVVGEDHWPLPTHREMLFIR